MDVISHYVFLPKKKMTKKNEENTDNKSNKIDFSELYATFNDVLCAIDCLLDGHSDYIEKEIACFNSFLDEVENTAIKMVAENKNLKESLVRLRWKILSLPVPIWDAIEKGSLSFTKAKAFISLNLDCMSEKDEQLTEEILNKISDMSCSEIKNLIQTESYRVKNAYNATMARIASQHNITLEKGISG